MSNALDEQSLERRGRAQKSGAVLAAVDEGTRARVETELRTALEGHPSEVASVILARAVAAGGAPDDRSVDAWYELAARTLAKEANLRSRWEQATKTERTVLALLTAHPWWSRNALVQAVCLRRGSDEDVGAVLGRVLTHWPVLLRTNSWSRSEEMALFAPIAQRVKAFVDDELSVGCAPGQALPRVGLQRALLGLALFPGLVVQRRPRVTRGGELHAADAVKLERVLQDARSLFVTWERLAVFEEVDAALSPIVGRIRHHLKKPRQLVTELLQQRLGPLGWALACLAAEGEPGDVFELGSALLSVGLSVGLKTGFDVASLATRVERDELRFSPFLHVEPTTNELALPPDVRDTMRGQAVVGGAPTATGFVQPNFEIVLPPGVPLEAAFVVGCAAELIHVEAVARLKISRESVLSARSLGLDVAAILDALMTVSGGRALPPAVRTAVEEWGDAVGEARIRTAVLLEVQAAPALIERVAEKLTALTLEHPAPHLFVLSRAPNPRELAALRAVGVSVRTAGGGTGSASSNDDSSPLSTDFLADGSVDSGAEPSSERKSTSSHKNKDGSARSARFTLDRTPPRDLRAELDPHRIVEFVTASRPQRRATPGAAGSEPTTAGGGASSAASEWGGSFAEAVFSALEERRNAWMDRPQHIHELRELVSSTSFRRLNESQPGVLALAIRRAGEPMSLRSEMARLSAAASIRRTAD